ncbi:MAG: TrmB family transcriptional regulator, partial [Methanomicrobiaceae archaeon]|nr:TrmB family transcriptional regulator [Methanomicrobiaceae archaeon]
SWYLLESTVLGLLAPLRGSVEIEIVTDDWQGDIPSDMAVHVHRIIPKKPLPKEHAGVFLVDESRVFVWLGSGDAPCALTSESPGFVQFFRRYLDNIREWASSAHQ